MFRFSIRDVLWLTVVVGMATCWYKDRETMAQLIAEMNAARAAETAKIKKQRTEMARQQATYIMLDTGTRCASLETGYFASYVAYTAEIATLAGGSKARFYATSDQRVFFEPAAKVESFLTGRKTYTPVCRREPPLDSLLFRETCHRPAASANIRLSYTNVALAPRTSTTCSATSFASC